MEGRLEMRGTLTPLLIDFFVQSWISVVNKHPSLSCYPSDGEMKLADNLDI